MAATHKTLAILSNAALEWILILMLLLNSLFSYLIRKFATHYALKPPCFWCSTIDHLFDQPNNKNPYRNLICEPHATEFFDHFYGLDCRPKVITESVDRAFSNASKIKGDYEKTDMMELMEVPIENTSSRHIQVFDQIIPFEWTDSSTSCSRSSCLSGDEGQAEDNGKNGVIYALDNGLELSSYEDEEDEKDKVVTMASLKEELKAERLVVCRLYIELEKERNASAIAANQAMAMITKLQEEKMALQIESVQNQRMMDEQAEYDQEVVQLLNELVMKLENDKAELENELELYKDRFLDYDEGGKRVKMMPRCHDGTYKESLDDKSSCSISSDNLNNMKALEDSIVEFRVERLLHVFDMKGIGEEVEASHSAWSRCSF